MDVNIRTNLMTNYISRNKGGRGLKSLEESYKSMKIKLAVKLMDDADHRLSIVRDFHEIHSSTNSYSIIKDAIRYSAESGVNMDLIGNTLVITDVESRGSKK